MMGRAAGQLRVSRAKFSTRKRGHKKRHNWPPSLLKRTAYEMVSLLVRNATTNHIFVFIIAWAFSVELGRAVGAVGGLIMAGEGVEFVAESQKDAMVLKHKMCLK